MIQTRIIRWREDEAAGIEHVVVAQSHDAICFDGVVVPGDPGFAATYRIECAPDWSVRRLDVGLVGRAVRLRLGHDGQGRWWRDGRPEAALDGILEPDLSISPLTNSFPIRRLGLGRGEGADIRAAYVSFPDLEVSADPQRYTCVEPGRLYRYDSRDSDFTRDIEVDGDGLVIDYPGLFRRIV